MLHSIGKLRFNQTQFILSPWGTFWNWYNLSLYNPAWSLHVMCLCYSSRRNHFKGCCAPLGIIPQWLHNIFPWIMIIYYLSHKFTLEQEIWRFQINISIPYFYIFNYKKSQSRVNNAPPFRINIMIKTKIKYHRDKFILVS